MEGKWSLPKLQLISDQTGISQQVIEEILDTPIVHGEPDMPRWSLSKSGDFTLVSAWETIRSQRPIIPALEDIWHSSITTSMSIFVWRLLSNRIPVDTKLQWRRIELASKCYCCPTRPGIESPQHLFVNGFGAASVWRAFDLWFPGATHPLRPGDSIPERLEGWAKRIKQPEKTHIGRIIPCLVMWFLWAERNRCRHNETPFRSQNVIWQVQVHIRKLMENGQLAQKQRRGTDINMPFTAHSDIGRPALLALPVKWNPRDPPWIKLNTACRYSEASDHASGGGTIRDHLGRLLLAFSVPLSATSALEASAKTVRIGLAEAKAIGPQIWVETDDPQVICLVKAKSYGPAQSRHEMARLLLLQKECTTRFSLICSAKNKAAACLAKTEGEATSICRFDGNTAPRILRAIILLERLGVPYLDEED